jgi:ATP-binding cassette subfamily B (MDR/TAP) protein 9
VVALMMGGGFVMTGKITPEQLTKFILYSEWVVHSTWWVGNHWSSLMQAIGASEKVFQLLDLPPGKQLSVDGNLNYQIKAVITLSHSIMERSMDCTSNLFEWI